jgi:GNAT superfamily N-acetyltransferase
MRYARARDSGWRKAMTRDELLLACFDTVAFPPGDVVLQVRSGADVLSHVDVYWRSVLVDAVEIPVAAIAQVSTDPAFRGLGFAGALVRAAHRVAAERRIEWAALFSDLDFYEKLGYVRPAVPPHENFVLCPLVPGREWPAGAIDTRGEW